VAATAGRFLPIRGVSNFWKMDVPDPAYTGDNEMWASPKSHEQTLELTCRKRATATAQLCEVDPTMSRSWRRGEEGPQRRR